MRDYSIDIQSEKIHSHKTRVYFEEVIKSYYSGSYRSAIVMLYSITLADLLFKLEELKDLYDDESAKDILAEIEKAKEHKNRLSEWEATLVEQINKKTNLFAPEDHLHIITLRDHRHLCAHPVITEHFELYQPNRETVRAHIRNILEGILTKPAILSKKILNSLLEDLADKKEILKEEKKLKIYLENKYFKRFNSKVKNSVFRSLWKIIFKLNDAKSNQHRHILYRSISHLLESDYNSYLSLIESEKDYYSDISEDQLHYASHLFNRNPKIYTKLNETFKSLLQSEAQRNANLDAYCIFLSSDVSTHINKVIAMNVSWQSPYDSPHIQTDTLIEIAEIAMLNDQRDKSFELLIEMFGNSGQYDQADERYDALIKPKLDQFTEVELRSVLNKMRTNSQISGRRNADSTKREIVRTLKSRFNTEPLDD